MSAEAYWARSGLCVISDRVSTGVESFQMPTLLLAPILSAIVGILLPALKDLVRTLQKNSKGEKFFASPIGKALLKFLDLDKPKDSPDLLFAELTEASQKMDGIVSRIQ
jgi:hypothetical protein